MAALAIKDSDIVDLAMRGGNNGTENLTLNKDHGAYISVMTVTAIFLSDVTNSR